jgi:hypothetical protein
VPQATWAASEGGGARLRPYASELGIRWFGRGPWFSSEQPVAGSSPARRASQNTVFKIENCPIVAIPAATGLVVLIIEEVMKLGQRLAQAESFPASQTAEDQQHERGM